jgi:hypothetical protein
MRFEKELSPSVANPQLSHLLQAERLKYISFSEIAITQSRGNKIPTGWETRK